MVKIPMPLTPFHIGPALLLGLIFFKYLDFPTFMLANVIIDIEPILVLLLDLNYPLHGFLHSFLGGTIVGFFLAWIMNKIRDDLSPLLRFFKIEQKSSFKSILITSLSGIYIHILLDSMVHMDIKPFYPLDLNPFLSGSTLIWLEIDMLSMWSFIGGLLIYAIRIFLIRRKLTN